MVDLLWFFFYNLGIKRTCHINDDDDLGTINYIKLYEKGLVSIHGGNYNMKIEIM